MHAVPPMPNKGAAFVTVPAGQAWHTLGDAAPTTWGGGDVSEGDAATAAAPPPLRTVDTEPSAQGVHCTDDALVA